MKRRDFLLSTAVAASAQESKPKLLLPTDQPDELGFRHMWHTPTPALDPATWRLEVKGLVDRSLTLALTDLRALPREEQSSRLKCVQCWSARTTWSGFRFAPFLDLAKPKKTARAIRIDCADKWYEYMSLEEMANPRVLFAMEMAGKTLPDVHGAPLRLVDPSKYGYKSAKQIVSITFVEEGKGSMACDVFPYYSPTGEIQAGNDRPQDLDGVRRKIKGGEITEY